MLRSIGVYGQWARFEDFPRFMQAVRHVIPRSMISGSIGKQNSPARSNSGTRQLPIEEDLQRFQKFMEERHDFDDQRLLSPAAVE